MGDSIVLTRDSSENPMKQTEILGYCQFTITYRGNTEIAMGEVVHLLLTNTGYEPRKWVFTNPRNTDMKCVTLQIYRKNNKMWEEIKDFRAIIRITNRTKQNI